MQLERVTKRYDGRAVVDGVSVEIRERELLALLGPSGSGKSTLLLMLAGLVKPDEGSVRVDGKIGMVFQDLALWPHMTADQHLRFVAPLEDPRPMLQLMELRPEALPGTLSGGEAQRLALARALIGRPKILFLDEPFGSLDRRIREKLLDQVQDLHRQFETTTVLVTHDYEEAFRIADRVAVLVSGKLVQVGSPADVYARPVSAQVAELTGPISAIDGRLVRPEQLRVSIDATSKEVVVGSRYRSGGRWLVQVARNGSTVWVDSPAAMPPGTRVRITEAL
jgi:ABC-type Fe3+/spermidine/putrescine transport system ATPase subunit